VLQPLLLEPVMGFGRKSELLSLMITFGLNYVLIELALQLWGSDYVSLPYLQSTWAIGGVILSKALVASGLFAAVIALILHFGLTGTLFGKTLLAASQSPTGAACCGIDVGRVRLVAFALGVGLASAAGALLILVIPMAAASADNLTILAFVIIALGGLGDYAGVVVAALLLGLAQSVVGYYLGGDAENVLPYALLILIMVARPQGFRRSA
jgi:branched-chain amino acid transport system permease protein